MLRKISGPKQGEVIGSRKLRNEGLHDFTPHQIKDGEMGRTCATTRRGETCTQRFGWKT